jgi:hypothetical protein
VAPGGSGALGRVEGDGDGETPDAGVAGVTAGNGEAGGTGEGVV